MLLAAELAAYGVDTVVLESRADVSGQAKATVLHARAVQCLARRGHLPGSVSARADGGAVVGSPSTSPACPDWSSRRPRANRRRSSSARRRGSSDISGSGPGWQARGSCASTG
ncbi:FAD-dependent monooxygenase [Streptomyces sp. M10(2022)]